MKEKAVPRSSSTFHVQRLLRIKNPGSSASGIILSSLAIKIVSSKETTLSVSGSKRLKRLMRHYKIRVQCIS